jgi:hypothetical protein
MTAIETCKFVNDVVTASLAFVAEKRLQDKMPNAYGVIPNDQWLALQAATDALHDHALAEAMATWHAMNTAPKDSQ